MLLNNWTISLKIWIKFKFRLEKIMFRSSNPVLSKMNEAPQGFVGTSTMTVNGTIGKTFLLLLIAAIAGGAVFYEALMGYSDKVITIITVALIAGLITGLVTSFVPKLAKFLSPIYAFCEGALLTGLSLILETQFPGIAVQAISSTLLCLGIMLFLYRAGAIKATEKFRAVIMSAMVTILVLYVINIIGGFFNFSIPFITGSGPMGIAFSAIVVAVASLSLILDFDFIEKGQAQMLPKDFEWYGAFGLLVTLVWLYIEILKLISKLRSND